VAPKTRRSVGDRGSAGRRGPEEPLSRDRIVSAALVLVDEEGLAALSMRRLAAALGVDPMAIYYYLPNKAALQDAIVEAVNTDLITNVEMFDYAIPVYDLVMGAGRVYRAALLRHPNAVGLMVVRAAATPASSRPGDAMLGGLIQCGFTPAEGVAAVDVFSAFVTASVLREVQLPAGPEHDPHVALRQMQESLDPAESPNLLRAVAEGNLMDFDTEFEFGLSALARGFDQLAADRTTQ
jgi:TetR/AcrR family transcriptional regulator, tetracycline repressor protein